MKELLSLSLAAVIAWSVSVASVQAADYVIDAKGGHAFIQFKIKHLGYSWLYGRFDDFSGDFSYDPEKPEASKVDVLIKTKSINSAHAERDKHLRGKDFLNVAKYPEASFSSTSFKPLGNGKAELKGGFTLNGISKNIIIDVEEIGGGKDPWGGIRQGFTGRAIIALKDFGIDYDLGPASTHVELILDVEGVR